MRARRSEVVVTLLWGDTAVHTERWEPRRGSDLSAPFDASRRLVRCTDDGELRVGCGDDHEVPLALGDRVELRLGDVGAYRAIGRAGDLVAIVELRERAPRDRAVAIAAALAMLVPLAVGVAEAFGGASRAGPMLDFDSVDVDDDGAPPRAHRPLELSVSMWLLDEQRQVEPDDTACGWGCGAGSGAEQAAIGLRRPSGTCMTVPRVHVVEAGETLSSIAHDFGFDDYRSLYNTRVNALLLMERRNPDRIYVGDAVVIPNRNGDPATACQAS